MSDITLVRQEGAILEADKEAARRVLFGLVDGLGDTGRRAWRRFVGTLMRLEPGEIVEIKTLKSRSGPFHRRHMLIESRVFDAQERFEHFKQFRDWLKVGAGYCDWVVGPKGGVIPVPKSIAFDQLEEDAMRQLHDEMVSFLRSEHAMKALWPKATANDRFAAIDRLLTEFGE